MISTLLAVAVLAPDFAETNITGATIFRNGYGFVVTATWLDNSGTTYIRALPQAVEGTLWFTPGLDAKIKDVTVTMVEVESIVQNAETIPGILSLNIGKAVSVTVFDGTQQKTKVMSGKILAVTPGQLLLQTSDEITAINFNGIQSLKGDYGDFKTTAETKVSVPVLKVESEPGTGGSLYTISLIDGISWLPAYNIELKDEGKLALTMKATILNSIGDFKNVDIGLMSGFPKIDGLNTRDPFTSGLQTVFAATKDSTRLAMVRGQLSFGRTGFGGGGGSRGGGDQFGDATTLTRGRGLVPDGITQVAYDPSDNSFIVRGTDKAIVQLENKLRSIERENFFIYGVPHFDQKTGDRKYMVIDEGELDYEMSHRISTTSSTGDVNAQKYLVFDNGLDVPLTKASAMLTRGGELIGKTEVPYTYMGGEVEMNIGTAPYIQTESKTEVIRSNKGKLQLADKRIFDEIEKKDVLTVTNLGDRPAKTILSHRLKGEVFHTSSRAIESKTTMTDAVNFDYLLEWEFELAPGETRTFEVEYSSYTYVRTAR